MIDHGVPRPRPVGGQLRRGHALGDGLHPDHRRSAASTTPYADGPAATHNRECDRHRRRRRHRHRLGRGRPSTTSPRRSTFTAGNDLGQRGLRRSTYTLHDLRSGRRHGLLGRTPPAAPTARKVSDDSNTNTCGSFKCTFPDGPASSTVRRAGDRLRRRRRQHGHADRLGRERRADGHARGRQRPLGRTRARRTPTATRSAIPARTRSRSSRRPAVPTATRSARLEHEHERRLLRLHLRRRPEQLDGVGAGQPTPTATRQLATADGDGHNVAPTVTLTASNDLGERGLDARLQLHGQRSGHRHGHARSRPQLRATAPRSPVRHVQRNTERELRLLLRRRPEQLHGLVPRQPTTTVTPALPTRSRDGQQRRADGRDQRRATSTRARRTA